MVEQQYQYICTRIVHAKPWMSIPSPDDRICDKPANLQIARADGSYDYLCPDHAAWDVHARAEFSVMGGPAYWKAIEATIDVLRKELADLSPDWPRQDHHKKV